MLFCIGSTRNKPAGGGGGGQGIYMTQDSIWALISRVEEIHKFPVIGHLINLQVSK